MALTAQQSMDQYGTVAYTGWGETEAAADAKAKGLTWGSSSNPYSSFYNQMGGSIDKYVQDLIDFAKDDYNFAAKWIEQQYTQALGTNDAERQEFLKSVANELENKVGRIAFDNQTNTYRLKEDTSTALKRLDEDERVANEEAGFEAQTTREEQMSSLNQRGLVSAPRGEQQGLGGKIIGELEDKIRMKKEDLQRYFGRGREDISLNQTRGLEDYTTTARRSALDTQTQRDYDLERIEREKQRRVLEAEQEKKKQKDYLASLGAYMS